ncbi:Outer membrane protein W precursor [Vibrio aerogenes CECT 7868]|uniref:Outer membrane protein W n=1 Tax=Vibrio aerogenes CECT 7868 TaxID=1216006 RepID=A0A1M6EGB0_9VIBR|nr:outer membrane protein OmpW [Vibrio aerogenes]SHI84505.1 Outer membrane protein W precursor [Vibrio aerogenes CECT 7868]
MKKTLYGLTLLASLISANVMAHQEGDFFMRAGLASVIPNDSSDKILGSDKELQVNTNTQLGLTFGYMVTDNISVELLAATPFSHDVSTNLAGLGDIGKTKHLPPTLMAEYYFGEPDATFRPYAGLGLNYTVFFDEKFNGTGSAAGLSDLSLDDSLGLAANIGFDYQLDETWSVNASLWYADIDTTATYKFTSGGVTTSHSTDISIDPVVLMVSVGYKF